MPVPKRVRQIAELVAEHHGNVHRADRLRPQKVFELLLHFDALAVRHADVPGIDALSGPAVGEAMRSAQHAAVVAALSGPTDD